MPGAPQVTSGASKTQPDAEDEEPDAETVANLAVAPAPSGTAVAEKPTAFFYVHQDLLAARSPELNRRVSSDKKEDLQDVLVLVLDDVEEFVIQSFVVWVYTGDYNPQRVRWW